MAGYNPIYDLTEFRPRVGRVGTQSRGAAAAQSLAEYIQKLSEMYIQHGLTNQQKTKDEQVGLGKTIQQDVRQNPESALTTISEAKQSPIAKGMNLDQMLPSPDIRLGPISNDISKAQTPLGIPDVVGRATRALTPAESAPQFGQTAQLPGVNADTEAGSTLPSTQFGPTQPPPIAKLMAQANQQRTAIDTETKRQLGIKTDTAGGEEAAREAAKAAPGLAAQQRANKVAEVNDLAGPNAAAAGQKTAAEKRAGLEPDIVSGEAAAAGKKKTSELTAEEPFKVKAEARIESREQRNSDRILQREKLLADWRNDHEITAPTRTMMEGAKMLLPHVQDLRAQAQILDKQGLFGPIMSRVRKLAEEAGSVEEFESKMNSDPQLQTDRKVGEFASTLGLFASGAGRVHGGSRGGSSIQMLNYMKSLVSDIGSEGMFEGKLDGAESYMKGYAAGPNAPAELRPPGFTWSNTPQQTNPEEDLVKRALDKINRRK